MGIKVREFWQLKEFQSFHLVAGEEGLDNVIENIGMLDYEFALEDDENPRRWGFRKADFVLTSFLFAKGRPELLLPAVKQLVRDQVAALAIKNVCVLTLPTEVIQYANENHFPIFMFGREDAYFEDIVVTLRERIKEKNNLDLQEYRLSLFMKGELDFKGQREVQQDMLKDQFADFSVFYCISKDSANRISDYRRSYVPGENVFFYKNGCFIVIYTTDLIDHDKTFQKYRSILQTNLRYSIDDYWIGVSRAHENFESLRDALQESYCSQMYASLFENNHVFFNEMGIYKALMPCYNNQWLRQFSSELLQQILDIDQEYDSSLYDTLRVYVRLHGNIQEIADEMHMHKNTVRYRINKARELLNMEDDQNFDLEISLAFMLDELHRRF